MIIGKVVGSVISTRKNENLVGNKFLIIEPIKSMAHAGDRLVAIDNVGAGFPSYGKIDARAKTIILNCAECEPLLRLHRQVLEKYPYEILSTLYQMALSIGCEQVIIGVKEAYRQTVEAVF